METYKLRNGVEIPVIGFGSWPLKGDVLENSLNVAFDNGISHIDTAHKYHNEGDIGDFLKKRQMDRKKIFLTSK